jgi:hypothetical protein
MQCFAIVEKEPKAIGLLLNLLDLSEVQVRNCLSLEPQPIIDEALQWHWRGEVASRGLLESLQGESLSRAGNVRCGPAGTKQHADRHIAQPKGHWFAKSVNVHPFDGVQMGRG